jgi:hypothetical protein
MPGSAADFLASFVSFLPLALASLFFSTLEVEIFLGDSAFLGEAFFSGLTTFLIGDFLGEAAFYLGTFIGDLDTDFLGVSIFLTGVTAFLTGVESLFILAGDSAFLDTLFLPV